MLRKSATRRTGGSEFWRVDTEGSRAKAGAAEKSRAQRSLAAPPQVLDACLASSGDYWAPKGEETALKMQNFFCQTQKAKAADEYGHVTPSRRYYAS